MSLWDKIKETITGESKEHSILQNTKAQRDASRCAFVDVEVGVDDARLYDIGALRYDDAVLHTANKNELKDFLKEVDYVCGHNIIHHDAKYLFEDTEHQWMLVDTLHVSPLLFPERPYHHLLKDDKLISEQLNNPVNDCKKCRDLLVDEVNRWLSLSDAKKTIYATLLQNEPEFVGFLDYVGASASKKEVATEMIRDEYQGKICENANIRDIVDQSPCELAYALALITTNDHSSITPPWVLHNYPNVENNVRLLRHMRCKDGCIYCDTTMDARRNLKQFFSYDAFRTYDGEPLQEDAVNAAIDGKSLLAIFPTGGGKSLTFQLPALIEGQLVHGLTVVISPLQSLMKDQVDNLADRGITNAVTINGMLDPISRSAALQQVQDGKASLLYISPEMLRSKTIENILLSRHVVRFVIDEAHCFSSWGQDFRVDYLYIGKFINEYQEKKQCQQPIPISCFTATAKQKVIQDICDYFKKTLNIDIEIYASAASRTNLHYSVIHADTDDDKYTKLRSLVSTFSCPTIIYVSRTRRTKELAQRLTHDGFKALPFNGKMEPEEKIKNQDAFMSDRVNIIVATSAFGMGVDKKDVGMVIHYDISDSLENYVQEAGRAGRDPQLQAKCFILYSDSDLDKHFILLNQTKLSISEIQQVWRAIKNMTRQRLTTNCSALEIARAAGWSDSGIEIETRIRTALSALEQAGYIERGKNMPHVYATGITIKNVDEARERITASSLFEEKDMENAVRIIKSLISQKYTSKNKDVAESRIDYLGDTLGISNKEVISVIERMQLAGILADSKDITAYLYDDKTTEKSSKSLLASYAKLERHIITNLPDEVLKTSYKQITDSASKGNIASVTEKNLRTLLNFLSIKHYIQRKEDALHNLELLRHANTETLLKRMEQRHEICKLAIEWLYSHTSSSSNDEQKTNGIHFSVIELTKHLKANGQNLFATLNDIQIDDVEEALLYLSKIGALKIEGGFMVIYNTLSIHRTTKDNKIQYKQNDYKLLNEFYKQKIQQIHIVGEYANLMVKDYNAAMQYVQDYFQMDYKKFISKYFKEKRLRDIEKNITPQKYRQLFDGLSEKQKLIISDKESRCIVVAAGPGSGKTRVLVHKLASLLLLEDVKHEQLLMLTFSRAAAMEFKQRLMELIGNAAHYVEIKTFHSYCFDLLGRIGNLDEAGNVVNQATQMIASGEVEAKRISKTVLVIDEAQDMSAEEYALIRALMNANEDMRIIAVGDDDQNIFEFRGSKSKYLSELKNAADARFIEMTENYRSAHHIVDFANSFVKKIHDRIKSTPIVSMSNDAGHVELTHHASPYMYEPLTNNILTNRERDKGSTCILTQTNEEAVILVALMRKRGVNSKLIQSMEGFRFWNMAEVRLFLKHIERHTHTSLIADDVWEQAKSKTLSTYAGSTSLLYLQNCLRQFEKTSNKCKYLTDFKEFVFESSIEDFCDIDKTDIVVSTIHKSKGREYDNVYMLLTQPQEVTDDLYRRYYVGFTRAKQRLYLHTNCSLLDMLPADKKNNDNKKYEMPSEVVLQLSHKDVNLGFFKNRKALILSHKAGDRLYYSNNYFYDDRQQPVAQMSQKMQAELERWNSKHYAVADATIQFVVAWRPKDAPKEENEHAVLLINMTLHKDD